MKALIIAAGEGKRFNDLTVKMPKPLLPVLGTSLIERIILTVKKTGINEFLIVIGHLGDKIRTKIGDGKKLGVQIKYIENKEWKKGNGLSVLKAENFLNENFFLLMSDHLFDEDVLVRIKQEKMNEDEIILVVDYNLSSKFVDVEDATKVKTYNNKILDIGKELKEYNAYDTGIFLCSPAIFKTLKKSIAENNSSLSGGVKILAKKGKVKAFNIKDSFWIDIDTKEYLKKAEQFIQKSKKGFKK